MDKLCDYEDSASQHSSQEAEREVVLAPEVDITDLQYAAMSKEI